MTFAARAVSVGVAVLVASIVAVGCDSVFRFDQPANAIADGGGVDEATTEDAGGRVPCADDTACGGLRCQVTTGMCVACVGDTDCSGALRHCDTAQGICVECNNASTDCAEHHVCDQQTRRCVDTCNDGDDRCPVSGFSCDVVHKICTECDSLRPCKVSSRPVCDPPTGRCVECAGDAQCPALKPVCDRRSGRCVACVRSVECDAGFVCDPTTLTCRSLQ